MGNPEYQLLSEQALNSEQGGLSPEVADYFPMWLGEKEGEDRPADLNIVIFASGDVLPIGVYNEYGDRDPEVYRNSDIEDRVVFISGSSHPFS